MRWDEMYVHDSISQTTRGKKNVQTILCDGWIFFPLILKTKTTTTTTTTTITTTTFTTLNARQTKKNHWKITATINMKNKRQKLNPANVIDG